MICGKDDSGNCCGKCFMPVVLMATHQRVEITSKNIELLLKQDVRIVLVVSLNTELEYYKKYPITVVLKENRPLGSKWQHGVMVAHKLQPNPLIILGSDDILHPDYLPKIEKLLEKYDFIGLTSWFTYDHRDGRLFKCNYTNRNKDFPIGSGKAFSLNLLNAMRWKVFDSTADRRLDDMSFRMANNHCANMHLIDEPLVLAYKGNWPVMNEVRAYLKSPNIKYEKADKSILTDFQCAG